MTMRPLLLPLRLASRPAATPSPLPRLQPTLPKRTLSSTAAHLAKPLPPRPTVPESTLTESFLKGTGPGGQKINKTSSAVQLKHLPTGLMVKCQETRSRSQNRKIARRILAERIEELEMGEGSRKAVKEEGLRRKKASRSKKSKRKYRLLAEKGVEGGAEEGEVELEGEYEEEGVDERVEESGSRPEAEQGQEEKSRQEPSDATQKTK